MKSLIFAPLAVLLMAAQPGQLPSAVYLPGAPLAFPAVVFQGDAGAPGAATGLPAVTTFPIYAPTFFEGPGGAITLAERGFDGGGLPGNIFHEHTQLTSLTMPAITVLNGLYTGFPECSCSWVTGTSIITQCTSAQDAGVNGPAGDGGPVTTVVVTTTDKDGGTVAIDCYGY